jgi:hypothetical protein
MAKGNSTKKPHKENVDKVLRTARTRARREAVVAARKLTKPQPIPQAGRATRRVGLAQKQVAA